MLALPVDPILPELIDLLSRSEKESSLVFHASPGSGKTTRVPPALLKARFRKPHEEILVLEPRRLAAKWAAHRVAEEMNEKIGETVGYQFRLERVDSSRTRLRFYTEGMLMRRLLGDPALQGAAAVVLDEFHERHLQGDLALAYLRWLQQTLRPDLRLVVMSATLDSEALQAYLSGSGQCPVLQVEQRRFPIEVNYLSFQEAASGERLERRVAKKVAEILESGTGGDILVFLPGMAEIRRCSEVLGAQDPGHTLRILPLHGELSREDQDRVMKRLPERKVILSTNLAETSLTIEGVTHVIDSGLHRQASYSWWSGVPALKTRPISKASAIQRAGRAGRTQAGWCHRLYSKGDFEGRAAFEKPEILRADLAQAILELKTLGVEDLSQFPWFEKPPDNLIEAAEVLLFRLGALDREKGGMITPLGRELALVPAHPRIGRLLWEARRRGVLKEAAHLGALIAEGELEEWDALHAGLRGVGRSWAVERVERQLLRLSEGFRPSLPSKKEAGAAASKDRALSQAVLHSFPDRVALVREGGGLRGQELALATGGSARLMENLPELNGRPVVVLSIQETQHSHQLRSELKVRSICPVSESDLFDVEPQGVRETEAMVWDEGTKRLLRVSRMEYGEIVLTEKKSPVGEFSPLDSAIQEEAVCLLLKSTLRLDLRTVEDLTPHDWIRALEGWANPEALASAFGRLALWSKTFQQSKAVNILERGALWRTIRSLCQEVNSEARMRAIDWPGAMIQCCFSGEASAELSSFERELPQLIILPSGRRTKVIYSLDQAPWLESRLQDFFGMKTGPTLLQGRLPLTLHLLAPNGRAVQVTSDLAGFWTRHYPDVRNELRRRYPKHAWPDNPLAPASVLRKH